ncbi:MAG TPA: sulfite exporter TauE/SafE family protein [Stellaceae bacterium]|nr:sulfite exporter TauE/SafE family protein [Stellaceae bacterium]
MDPVSLALASLCVFLGGAVKGVAALGLPLVSIPLLAWVVGLKSAVALLVVPMFGSNFVQSFQGGLFLANLRRFRVLAATVLVFTLIGTRLLVRLPQHVLALVIGLSLIVLPLVIHFQPSLVVSERQRRWADPLVGAVAGLLGGIAAYYGPPIMLYLMGLRLTRDEFVSAISLLYWIAAAGIFVGVLGSGAASLATLGLSVAMLLPTGLGMWLGQRVQVRLGEAAFRHLLIAVYLVTGTSFLARAIL